MSTAPFIVTTQDQLRAQIQAWKMQGERIGFVPTMGALHAGHLSLIHQAKQHADKIVASIYINPTQFSEGEDLGTYPRSEEKDAKMLCEAGCDLIYIPTGSLYGEHHATSLHVGGAALGLETDYRPHFFGGVALIVTKLLNRVQPDVAVFGEKDYQQLLTIRRITSDLDIPVEIFGAPIVRENDGLAMSSRNQYFDTKGRAIAGQLNIIMRSCAQEISETRNIKHATDTAIDALLEAGFTSVDYVSVADAVSLEVLPHSLGDNEARLLIAATCKGVRLIDNCAID
ncbi:MAG: pantoate--beta-alanine ligase [Robiginitomaculum sp.]|nr:MAG: pantoate--beta-alanine ligase [Robiginitomaculum sp.]